MVNRGLARLVDIIINSVKVSASLVMIRYTCTWLISIAGFLKKVLDSLGLEFMKHILE